MHAELITQPDSSDDDPQPKAERTPFSIPPGKCVIVLAVFDDGTVAYQESFGPDDLDKITAECGPVIGEAVKDAMDLSP